MLDIALLKIMKYRNDYKKIVGSVPRAAMHEKTLALLDDFGKYFEKFPEHERVDLQVFLPRFKQWHPGMTDEMFANYTTILSNIQADVDESTRDGILNDMYEAEAATKAANLCREYVDGVLRMPLADALSAVIDVYKINTGAKAANWIDTDIGDLLQDEIDEAGVQWRLRCLRESMRPLRPGDFGIIAARPDKGKTTFLASEVTHMANQLPEDKNIIWLNNEGPGRRIIPRLYQAALGTTMAETVELHKSGKLVQMYEEILGRKDRIRVVDIHGYHVGQVEAIIENMNAGIVIFDMIDHIRGFGGEARTDLQLEEMYKWARERAVKYSCICLATSQISNEGDGLIFPTLPMLKDSKTGKQGACDFQLMIGASNDDNLRYARYVSLPKNKLRREGFPSDPRCEVKFNPTIARFEDIDVGS